MKNSAPLHCAIEDIAYYLPAKIVDNAALAARFPSWSEKKIFEKTGIRQRHVVDDQEYVSDIAVKAAEQLFRQGSIKLKDVDCLLLCTQTPDYALPGTSSLVHHRLGLPKSCVTFDVNHGCTGFIYSLFIVGSMIESGLIRNALIITAETYSRWCHPKDKSVCAIFGDAAAATFVTRSSKPLLGPFLFGNDGGGFKNLTVPVSGSHARREDKKAHEEYADTSGNVRTPSNLYMNGPDVFRFTLAEVPALVENLLSLAHKKKSDIDQFVLHQANTYMLKHLQEKMGIPDDKMIYEMEDIGNTVSASIPIALKRAQDKKIIKKGDALLLAGFGLGYSWGGTLLTWAPKD